MRTQMQDSGPDDARWSIWMANAQAGDQVAYRHLLKEILPVIRLIVKRKVSAPERVEDIVQEVLISLHKNRHTYDPKLPFKPWLVTIIQRRTLDALRKLYRDNSHEVLVDDFYETFDSLEANSPIDDAIDFSDEDLKQALDSLPEGQRKAVELLKLHEMTMKEASSVSGMSIAALKVAMHRALKGLREKMAGVHEK